jgi:DNA-binding SARP family transcriptional activator/tetratricopeptide (TPR) repeat protein
MSTRSHLELNILGPFEIRRAGQLVSTTNGRMVAVLVTLALSVGRPVESSTLIEAVWGSRLPRSAAASLQTHVMRLRRLLGADVIRTVPAGYLLDLEPDQVDLWRFRRLVDAAAVARDPGTARDLLVRALALWRGEPLAGLPSDELRHTMVPSLVEERLVAFDHRIELDFAAGRHAGTIVELQQAVVSHPLRETSWRQLITALAAVGRKVEALDRYHEIQVRLRDQLGTSPSAALRALHERLLLPEPTGRGDRLARNASTGTRPGRVDQRSDLPGDLADLTGRQVEIDWLLAALPDDPEQAVAPTVLAVDGMAGVGKTALAVHLAHRLAPRCPDGQLFIDLQGHTPGQRPIEPAAALASLLAAVGVSDDQVPDTLDERAALWRAKLAGRRVLVLLDNAANTAQVRHLLPGAAGCVAMITSRCRLLALTAARALSLDVLPRPDALHLLATIIGQQRVDGEPEAAREVVELCGGLPLAIRIAGARLAARSSWSVGHLAERLRDQCRRLSELAAEDQSVAATFTVSYQQLTPEQQHLFRALGAHPGPDVDRYLAAAVADVDLPAAQRGLEGLLDAHLLQQSAIDRYRFHDLLREHARHVAEHAGLPNAEQERRVAVARLLDYYLAVAAVAGRLISPTTRMPTVRPVHPPTATPLLASQADAIAWCERERSNLVAAITFAAAEGWYTHAWQLPLLLWRFFHLRGHFQDWLAVGRLASGVLDQVNDPSAGPETLRALGLAYHQIGRATEALRLMERARAGFEAIGDWDGQAAVSGHLGLMTAHAGRCGEALGYHWRALELFQRAKAERGQPGSLLGEATNLASLGNALLVMGRRHSAIGYHQRALAVSREIEDRRGEGAAAAFLAVALQRAGRVAEALEYHELSLWLARENGDRSSAALTLNSLGVLHRQHGDLDQALLHHRQGLELIGEIGDRSREAEIVNDYATTLLLAGRREAAVGRFTNALELATTFACRYEVARAHRGLSYALAGTDAPRAAEHRRSASAIFASLGVPEADGPVDAARDRNGSVSRR